MNSKKSQAEDTGYANAGQDRAKAEGLADQVTQNNSQYNGPVQQTPFYKSLLKTGTDSTNMAYDNASRNLKQSMQGAGVGGSSGVVAGNNGAMAANRARDLGTVGNSATMDASQMQLNSNAQQLQQAGMFSGAGLGYFGNASTAEQQRLARQGSLWNGLLQAGASLGEAAILA